MENNNNNKESNDNITKIHHRYFYSEMGISKINNYLYLGAARDTKNVHQMKRFNITHIVSCAGNVKNPNDYTILKAENLEDIPKQDIMTFAKQAIEFIEDAQSKGGVVFVHCLAGRSRSPTIILAYLLVKQQLPLKQLYQFVYQCRDIIQPNDGFMQQLVEFEKECLGLTATTAEDDNNNKEWWKSIKPALSAKQQRIQYQQQQRIEQINQLEQELYSNNSINNNYRTFANELESLSTITTTLTTTSTITTTTATTTTTKDNSFINQECNEKIQVYLKRILTIDIILQAIDNVDNLFQTLRNNVLSDKSCHLALGQVKKHVGKELFKLTFGGQELISLDNRIQWKDIVNSMEPIIIDLLEKDIFQKKIIM